MSDRCVICLTALDVKPTSKLSCDHEFHSDCVITMFQTMGKTSCPLCRKDRDDGGEYERIRRSHLRVIKQDIIEKLPSGKRKLQALYSNVESYKSSVKDYKKLRMEVFLDWSKVHLRINARAKVLMKQILEECKDEKKKFLSVHKVKELSKKRAQLRRLKKKISNAATSLTNSVPGLLYEDLVRFEKGVRMFTCFEKFNVCVNHFASNMKCKFKVPMALPQSVIHSADEINML